MVMNDDFWEERDRKERYVHIEDGIKFLCWWGGLELVEIVAVANAMWKFRKVGIAYDVFVDYVERERRRLLGKDDGQVQSEG